MKAFRSFLPSRRLHPGLLISANFEKSSYSIYVTDGTYLWKQTISPSELQTLSSKFDSPIDAEEPEQLKILLSKLRQGLLCKGDGHDGTEAKLFSGGLKTIGGIPGRLVIHTKIPLDAPLPPLEWKFDLSLTSQTEFTSTFTIPLARLVGLYQTKTNELLEQIKNKDTIIAKLKDNAELQKKGAVAEIFHNKRSRQGLNKFDKEEWKNSFLSDGGNADMDWLYKDGEDGEDGEVAFEAVLGEEERVDQSWWDDLSLEDDMPISRQSPKGSKAKVKSSPRKSVEKRAVTISPRKPAPGLKPSEVHGMDADVDMKDEIIWTPDFDSKSVPPPIQHITEPSFAKQAPEPKDPDDPYATASEDDEDDDLDRPNSRGTSKPAAIPAPSPPKPAPSRGGIGKLGAIRSRKRSLTPKAATPPRDDSETGGDETASEDEHVANDLHAASNKNPAQTITPEKTNLQASTTATPASKGKATLGALGRKVTPEVTVQAMKSPERESPIKPVQSQTLGRLGGIGAGRSKETEKARVVQSGSSISQQNISENQAAPVDPLDQEAADRKRKELERALEEKKKAPVRKKRKF